MTIIYQYDMNGKLVRKWEWNKLKEYCIEKSSLTQFRTISNHIWNESPSCYSFIWRGYLSDDIVYKGKHSSLHDPFNSKYKHLFE